MTLSFRVKWNSVFLADVKRYECAYRFPGFLDDPILPTSYASFNLSFRRIWGRVLDQVLRELDPELTLLRGHRVGVGTRYGIWRAWRG